VAHVSTALPGVLGGVAAGHEGTAAVDAKNPVLLKVELTGVFFAGFTVELVACETLTATAT